MYTVLNGSLQVKGKLTLNNGQGSTAFFNDSIKQQMATENTNLANDISIAFNELDKQGNAKQWGHSLELNVEATDLGTSITTSDYIMYYDAVASHYYLMKVLDTDTDRDSGFIKVNTINAAIYELGKIRTPTERKFTNSSLQTVVSDLYKFAPFSLRVSSEVISSLDYTVPADTSLQATIQDLQTKYDVDVDSWIELDSSGNISERIIYFGHIGSNNGELIRYGGAKGFENMTAQEVSDSIYTKLWVKGQTDTNVPSLGHISSVNNGMEYITDDKANSSLYPVGASQQQPVYLEGSITNTILSQPTALLTWAKAQMKIFNHPRFNYKVTPLHDQIVGMGDLIRVQDFHIKPMILVESTVIQKTTSFASPETNTFVLGEFSSIFTENANRTSGIITLIKKDVTVVQEAADNARIAADEAHKQAVAAQQASLKAQTTADGKLTAFTVTDIQSLPEIAREGDIAWFTDASGTYGYTYINGKWTEDINPNLKKSIQDGVTTAISTAKADTEKAIADNNTSINNTVNEVAQEKIDLAIKDGDFNNKAQAMADKALSDAKSNTVQVAQETLNSANDSIAQAKYAITDAYKNADGVISKKVDDTATSIGNTISQNKIDSDGKISTAQSTATQALNEVITKVSQTVYDQKTGDLTQAISKAQSTADGVVSTVGNYKTSNDGRVKAAESKIEQNSKDITARVSKTDYNNNNSQLNTRFTKVEATADGASTTVSELQQTVNSLGQTNLINNSDFSPDLGGWTTRGDGNFTTGDYDYGGGVYVVESTSGSLARTNSAPIPLNGNSSRAYSLSFNAYIFSLPSGGRVVFQLTFLDANLNETSNSYPGYTELGPQGTGKWFNIKLNNITFTPPAGAAYIVLSFDARGIGTKAGFSKPILVSGSTVGSYVRGQYSNNDKIALQQITIDSISDTVSNPTTGLSTRVQTAEGFLTQVRGTDIPALQNATFWQPYSSLNFNDYTKQGSIFFNTTAAKTNGPTTSNAWTYLIVEQGTSAKDRIKQTAWYDGVTGVKITYVRTLNSGTWSPWYANDNDSVTTISQTNSDVRQEISDRKTGDNNTLQSSKNFTQSTITNYDRGMQTQLTQTASGILAQVESTNMVVNSEFDPLNGTFYRLTATGATGSQLAEAWNAPAAGGFTDWPVVNGSRVVSYTVNTWYSSALVSTSAGKAFSASIVAGRSPAPTVPTALDFRIGFWDSSRKLITTASAGNIIDGIAYKGIQKYVVENKTAPANTAFVSIIIAHSSASATDYITRPSLNAGDKASPYTPTYGTSSSSTVLSLFKDNWSIGINDNISKITSGIVGNASQMSLISKKVVIDSPSTQITGTAWIKSAMIANGAIGTAQIGDAVITSAKIANLDVSKLTGDTITGFNFNVNRSMNIASGGVIKSDVISMDKTSFILNTSTVATDTVTTAANNKMILSNVTYSIDSTKGAIISSGKVNISRTNGSTSNANFNFRIAPDYFSMSSKNWSDGSNDNYMTMTDYSVAFLAGSPLIDKASSYSYVGQDGISTTGTVLADAISGHGSKPMYINAGGTLRLATNNGRGVKVYISDTKVQTDAPIVSGNITLNTGHAIVSNDNGKMFFYGSNGNQIDLGVKSVTQSSLVSLKEHIGKVTPKQLLSETLRADIRSYNFTGDDITDKHVTPMIDDVNHEMYIPNDWLSPEGTGVDTYSIIGYLIGSVKALQEQITELKAN